MSDKLQFVVSTNRMSQRQTEVCRTSVLSDLKSYEIESSGGYSRASFSRYTDGSKFLVVFSVTLGMLIGEAANC